MDETVTQMQREAVEAPEGARCASVPLSDYAKAMGLELRQVYDVAAVQCSARIFGFIVVTSEEGSRRVRAPRAATLRAVR